MLKKIMLSDISYIIIACYPDKGMKSHGSKSLIELGKKKLLEYQIDCISHSKHNNYQIVVISDFEIQKIQKQFPNIEIVRLESTNPVYLGCELSKYEQTIFIDYGCLFSKKVINDIKNNSCVVCATSSKNTALDIGCVVKNRFLEHIFFDLPENKFCNIFSLSEEDKKRVLRTSSLNYFNLMSFEIINKLVSDGSIFDVRIAKSDEFIYFNNMRQKNAINKFIKQTYH